MEKRSKRRIWCAEVSANSARVLQDYCSKAFLALRDGFLWRKRTPCCPSVKGAFRGALHPSSRFCQSFLAWLRCQLFSQNQQLERRSGSLRRGGGGGDKSLKIKNSWLDKLNSSKNYFLKKSRAGSGCLISALWWQREENCKFEAEGGFILLLFIIK